MTDGGFSLRGLTPLTLDDKGRFAMPSKYRSPLEVSCEKKLIITVDPDGCLIIYPLPVWQQVEQGLISSPNRIRKLKRLLMGYATDCEMDKQGRVAISPALRQYAGLDKTRKMVLVGQGNKFELWNEALWYENEAQLLKEDKQELISLIEEHDAVMY